MRFEVRDLMVSLSGPVASEQGGVDTCSGVTKPTGCVNASIFDQAGAASRNLSVLRGHLRKAMTRA